jgi:phosphoglycolate phosphatase
MAGMEKKSLERPDETRTIAIERVERLRDERYLLEEIWVIGDTPGDLACARAAGVQCLLVGTGQIPMAQLLSLDADAVIEDFTNTDEVVQTLTR